MLAQGVGPLAIAATVLAVLLCLWFVAYRRVLAHDREGTGAAAPGSTPGPGGPL